MFPIRRTDHLDDARTRDPAKGAGRRCGLRHRRARADPGATGWGGRPLLRYLASIGSAAVSA
ncbi:MAG TPA: hypothetical protein VFG35_09390 [Actinoplanes sp.]|nr:hypothetical protein [Actinoplanes sp.]